MRLQGRLRRGLRREAAAQLYRPVKPGGRFCLFYYKVNFSLIFGFIYENNIRKPRLIAVNLCRSKARLSR